MPARSRRASCPPPPLAGLDLAAVSEPAETVSGDYYDFVQVKDGGLMLAVGDASGHGLGPALITAEVRACLRSLMRSDLDTARILTSANDILIRSILENHFISLFLLCIQIEGRCISYASAGHPTGYVLDKDGQIKARMLSTGFPIGIDPVAVMEPGPQVVLDDGDLVMLMTDGVLETRGSAKGLFGIDRLLEVVRDRQKQSSRCIVEAAIEAVRRFAAPTVPADDMTLVVMKAVS